MNLHNKKSKRSVRRTVSLAAAAASLAAIGAAGVASPASALSTTVKFGHPGGVHFAYKDGQEAPFFQATDGGRNATNRVVTFSTGPMVIDPDPIAEEGDQWANVYYDLYERDPYGDWYLVKETKTVAVDLAKDGVNRPTAFAGSGKIATLKVAKGDRFRIEVKVNRFVDTDWQSSVVLAPNQSKELDCRVNACSASVPSQGPAFLAFY